MEQISLGADFAVDTLLIDQPWPAPVGRIADGQVEPTAQLIDKQDRVVRQSHDLLRDGDLLVIHLARSGDSTRRSFKSGVNS